MLFFLIGCAGVSENKSSRPVAKTRMPVNLQANDVLISFVIEGINFGRWQKNILENAAAVARQYNLTFELATFAEPFTRKHKDAWTVYENNKDVFEIIAFGYNNVNPVDSKRSGEFFDITTKKQIPPELQEEKIKNMKGIFEKNNIMPAMQVFLVPWYAGDENTIKIAEKYGYKLIIQENIGGNAGDLVKNYETITASKCYVNAPNRYNITDRDINYMSKKMQKYFDNRIKRIYIVFHPVNFNTIEALSYTKKMIDEIGFKFKNVNVFYGMITDGMR